MKTERDLHENEVDLEEGLRMMSEIFFKGQLKEVKEQGIQEGIEKGLEKGMEQAAISFARELLADGMDVAVVAKYTKLPISRIEALKRDEK